MANGQGMPVQKNARDTIPIKYDSLKAAIVTATMRPRMKGDTLEYNTEHVLMRPNAVVEELLRRLPGLRVAPDGTITYNGEKIQHLLVDGEDIFGDDPTLVTRNFDAGKIARVQILDRKTDQAIFTGMDDGTRVKTLNLVMKESARNGYFGRLEAGGNPGGYYTAGGALAGFRDREQLTALGLSGNTGVLGFSGDGGSPASIGFLYSIADPLGASAGTGIPHFTATALHYANHWNGADDHLAGNYQYGHYWTHPITTTQTLQIQPGSVYGQQQQSQSINQQDQHSAGGMYEWALSPRAAVQLSVRGNFYLYQNQYGAITNSTFNDTLVNSSRRSIRDETGRQNLSGTAAWRIQVGKQSGSVFSVVTGLTKTDYTTNGFLFSLNRFYKPDGSLLNVDTVDQRKQIADHALSFHGAMNYTRPVYPGTILGISYGLAATDDAPLQASYARGEGKYDALIDSLGSNLKTRTVNYQATINLQGKARRLSYSLGSDWLDYTYYQRDMVADSTVRLHYINWAPRLRLNYTLKPAFSINFNYNAATQQPSVTQLAPIKNNNDPLHLTLGNPALQPGTRQSFWFGINWLKAWMVGLGFNMAFSNRDIGTKTITDSLGRQLSQPVNVDGGRSAGINFSLGHKFGGVDWGFHTSFSGTRTMNFVNADLSRNDAYTTGGGLSASRYAADKYNFQLNTDVSYFYSRSSINTAAPVHYWTQSHSAMASFYFIPHYQLGTSATYTWQEKTSSFSAGTSVLLWNAYASRNLLQDKLVVKIVLNNILGQNAGISRTNSANVNTQTATNILGRYGMLSVVYHFDKKFKKK